MSSPELSPAVAMIRAFHPIELLETIQPGTLTVACTGERPTDYVVDGEIMGIHGEVRRRVAGLRHGDPAFLHEHDGLSLLREQVPRRDAGDAAADDGNVGVSVVGQRGKTGRGRRVDPERERSVGSCGMCHTPAIGVQEAGREVSHLMDAGCA